MQQGLSGYIVGKSVPPERPWQQERAKASHNPSPSHTPDARTRFRVRMQPAEPSYGGPSRTHMLLLEQDTARAVEILRKLTAPNSHIKHNLPEISGAEIAASPGVAFTFVTKAGVGLSGMTGRGFVLRRLSDTTCDAALWTAPVFFNIRGAGLGLTLGYATIDSLLLMDSEGALDAYYKTQASFDIDMELAGGKDRGGRLPGTPLNVPSVRSGFKTWEYSVSSGALLDLSLRGGSIHRDDPLMRKLYGRDVLMADVVAGRVPLPPEMMPLYTELQQLSSCSERLLDS